MLAGKYAGSTVHIFVLHRGKELVNTIPTLTLGANYNMASQWLLAPPFQERWMDCVDLQTKLEENQHINGALASHSKPVLVLLRE